MQANLFELRDLALKITYSSSSFDGKPQLTYTKGATTRTFRGAELRQVKNEIGTLVSVTLKAIPDLATTVFTLLVPQVNVPDNHPKVAIETKALETTIRTTIGGPDLVPGQVQTYKAYSLKGNASHVLF